jgi:GGDEF domain-containing protein
MRSFEDSIGKLRDTAAAETSAPKQDWKTLQECYSLSLRSAADYAVELDPPAMQEFQRHVRAMATRASTGLNAEDFRGLQASFRGELREYRDKGRVFVQRLRDDLEGAAEAMKNFANSFVANGEDGQKRVRAKVAMLQRAAESGDLEKIRESVRAVAEEIERTYEELNKANTLTVAELQHEIRLLHREMEAERRALWTDAASGAWVKKKLDDRMHELLKNSEAFCVIILLVTNLKRLENGCGKNLTDGALRAMVKRFYGIVGEESLVARLSEDQFAAVIEVDLAAAQTIAKNANERLSTRYSVQEAGVAQNLELRVSCGLVGHARGADPAAFRLKIQQMTGFAEAGRVLPAK